MNNYLQKKIRSNDAFKIATQIFSLILIVLFLALIIFISIKAAEGFKNVGFQNILFTINFSQDFTAANGEFSFWLPFSVTLITSLTSLIIAVPLGIKSAIFITFRAGKKYRKSLKMIFEMLSGVPSVIFGLFAINSLGVLMQTLFGIKAYSIFTASIMLSFMILPTIISMTVNSLDSVDRSLLINPIALGNTKTRSIYKIYLKAARQGILIAVIVAFGRSISESMAVSMILQSGPNEFMYDDGFFAIFNSANQTIGAFISSNMFADSNPEISRPILYVFGLLMLFMSMILNFIVIIFARKKKSGSIKVRAFENKVYEILAFIPNNIIYMVDGLFFRSKYSRNNPDQCIEYTKDRIKNYKLREAYSVWQIFWEWFAIIICSSFLFWILGDILIKGISFSTLPSSTIFNYSQNQVGQSFLITLLIILVSLFISFPICLLIAVYLNEYAEEGKFKKTILFFIDSLGSTPSILFGMFGLLFFIETLGITNTGRAGNSIIAGCLTMVIVIIPSFTRILFQSLSNVSNNIRWNSFALGCTKYETITKLILPIAFNGIITSIVLTVGRILSETAPLYLTAGLSSSKQIGLDRPGMSLTTQIYSQLYSTSPTSLNVQYEAAFITLLLVSGLVITGYWVIPNWPKIRNYLIDLFYKIKLEVQRKKND
ncbi:MAG: phosphate ABC transporter permease PstA [Mycoplasmoidaceae bacterium]